MSGFVITNVQNAGIFDTTSKVLLAPFTKLDSVILDIDSKMTEVYAGQSTYSQVNISADRKPKVALKGPEMNLGAYYRLLGATNTPASAGTPIQLPAFETVIIPAGGAYALKNQQSAVDTVITVMGYIDDAPFSKVASAPTAGQYSAATVSTVTTLTFNIGDVGKSVIISYSYDSQVGGQIDVPSNAIPGIYTFKGVGKVLQNINDPAKTAYDVAFIIPSCQFIGNLQISSERQKAASASLDLSILDPGAGLLPISIRTTAKYA